MSEIMRCDWCGYEENYSRPAYFERRTFQERDELGVVLHKCSVCVIEDASSASLLSKGD